LCTSLRVKEDKVDIFSDVKAFENSRPARGASMDQGLCSSTSSPLPTPLLICATATVAISAANTPYNISTLQLTLPCSSVMTATAHLAVNKLWISISIRQLTPSCSSAMTATARLAVNRRQLRQGNTNHKSFKAKAPFVPEAQVE
jgi:hypothetical protein